MKKLLIIAMSFLLLAGANAQDVIILQNGDEINAVVLEVGTSEIKYKRFENKETSPVYSLYKNDVFMIKYADGTKDVFNKPKEQSTEPTKVENSGIAKKRDIPEIPATDTTDLDGMSDEELEKWEQLSKFEQRYYLKKHGTPEMKKKYGTPRMKKKHETPENHGKMMESKFLIGGSFSLLNSYKMGNLEEFWQYITRNPSIAAPLAATGILAVNMGSMSSLDSAGKNWMGVEGQFVSTSSSHTIWGTNLFYGGKDEVYFNAKFINIVLSYGRILDTKNNLLLIIEPGLDIGLMGGKIIVNSKIYEQSFAVGVGGHMAVGINYMFSKHIGATARLGYRFIKIDETHQDTSSTTGYSSFYANGKDGETVKVDWSGMYFTVGLVLSFNVKPRVRRSFK